MLVLKLRMAWLAVMSVICLVPGSLASAHAEPIGKSPDCTKAYYEARAANGKLTPGEMVASGILTGAIGLGITAAIRADQGEKAAVAAEERCLISHGLLKPRRPAGEPRAPGEHVESQSGGKCACPEMRTCNGSWRTLSCSKLKELCSSSTNALVYAKNSCTKFNQLVRN